MQQQTLARTLSLCLSVVLTLAMLFGMDHLAQQEQASPMWAQASMKCA